VPECGTVLGLRIQRHAIALIVGMACLSVDSPHAQPSFRSGTTLVVIDVVATRANGQPARGLTADDFEVREDGVIQKIETVQFVDAPAMPTTTVPAGVFTNQLPTAGLFALVIDELTLDVTLTGVVRRTAERFLDNAMQPGDRVAVVRTGVESGFLFTDDRRMAMGVVSASAPRAERSLGLSEPAAPTPGTVMPGGDSSILDGNARAAEALSLTPGQTGRNSLDTLTAVVDRLGAVAARRKAVLWMTAGTAVTLESILDGSGSGRAVDNTRRLIDRARAANVAIYTIDPRGLTGVVSPDDRDAPLPQVGTAAAGELRDIAAATGGRAVLNTNDVDGALREVARENRAYYLIGYTPREAVAGRARARRLDVRTRAPGVALLHRLAYAPTADAPPVRANEPFIAQPLPVPDLPIRVAPALVVESRGQVAVAVPFVLGAGLADGLEVAYQVVAYDVRGAVRAQASGRARARDGVASGLERLTLGPGPYQLRLAAQIDQGPRGLAFAAVDVPGDSGDARCGGFVFDQGADGRALGNVARLVARDRPLRVAVVISATRAPEKLAFGLGVAGGSPQRTWPAEPQPIRKGVWQVGLRLTPPLPRGLASLSIVADGRTLGSDCETTVRFE